MFTVLSIHEMFSHVLFKNSHSLDFACFCFILFVSLIPFVRYNSSTNFAAALFKENVFEPGGAYPNFYCHITSVNKS